MRTLIYALHLTAVAFLLFSKGTPPIKKAKLYFITPKQRMEQIVAAPPKVIPAHIPPKQNTQPPVESKKTEKPAPPKPKPSPKKETKTTPAKKGKEPPSTKPSLKQEEISEEKKLKELESLKKIESLLEELQAPPPPTPKKATAKNSSRNIPLPKVLPANESLLVREGIAFDGAMIQDLLFDNLQLPQAGEVELELEIEENSLRIAKIIQSQNDENLAYLLKKIPQIELGNCKKIAGLENGMRLRITFCTKPT